MAEKGFPRLRIWEALGRQKSDFESKRWIYLLYVGSSCPNKQKRIDE
jgi:hypothetical protein